jgi:pimeloyl-ACP methyl ester carboxylesterase
VVAVLTVVLAGQPSSTRTAQGMVYERAGSGPAIVFIHGAFLDRRQWNREFDRFKGGFTVVRYDQRAHGESAVPPEPASPVDDLFALLDELKIQRATLVGLSSGSRIALDAALANPDRVERLVMAGPAISGYVPKERPAFAVELGAALKAGDYKKATGILLETPVYATPEPARALVRSMLTANEHMWTLDPKLIRPELKAAMDRLFEVRTPTLVLLGDKDTADSYEQAKVLESRIRGAMLVTVSGGGHLLNLTSPDEFERALREFLKRP